MNELITINANEEILTKDGGIILNKMDGTTVVITNKEQAKHLATAKYICGLQNVTDIAISYELASLTEKMAADFGFTSVNALIQANFNSIEPTKVSRYRRVGKMFIQRYFNENGGYSYGLRAPLPEGVSLTNLTEILPLLGVKDWSKLDDFTEDEISDCVNAFCELYIIPADGETDGKLHLLAPTKRLREEKAKLLATDKLSAKKEAKKDDKKFETETVETETKLTVSETMRSYLDALTEYFNGNTKALKAIASLIETVNANIETEKASVETENENK